MFSITELILAAFVVAVALFVLTSIFSSGARQAVQTRNRAAALLIVDSLLEEVRAHPYGAPRRTWWPPESEPSYTEPDGSPTVERVIAYVDDRPQEMRFFLQMRFENGAFVDASRPESSDRVFLTVSWREVQPSNAAPEVKKVEAERVVWRAHEP